MPGGLGGIIDGIGGTLGGVGGTLPGGGQPATVFRAYAEARLGTAAPRRFLLQLDPSEVTAGAAVVLNHLDIDAAHPRPDLTVRVTPNLTADGLTIELRPTADRMLTQVSLFVYIALDTDVFPAAGAAPDAAFAYFGYTGRPGEAMPGRITAVLRQQAEAADDHVELKLSLDGGADPTTIHGGTFATTTTLAPAVQSLYVAATGSYTELPAVDVRTGDRTTAPTALAAELDLRAHVGDALTMDVNAPLHAVIRTPHAFVIDRDAPVATRIGAGGVDVGAHTYKVTFLLDNGNETGTTDTSAVVTVTDPATDGRIRLSGLPAAPAAPPTDPGVAARAMRIYRTKAGDSGEHFLVAEVPRGTTEYEDDVPDDALGPVPDTRMHVTVQRPIELDLFARIDTRDRGRSNRIEADLYAFPDDIDVAYRSRPSAGEARVTYRANGRLPRAEVRLPRLSGDYDRAEVRLRDLSDRLGVDWLMESPTRMRLEIGDHHVGDPADPIGSLAALLSHGAQPWRDAPQTVAIELVDRRSAPQTIQSKRLRAGVRGLRRLRLALGEGGHRHSQTDQGVVATLELGPDPGPGGQVRPPAERSLRLLRVDAPPAADDHAHLLVRAGGLPDRVDIDLRARDDYFGVEARGVLRRLRVLSLERPTPGSASFAAEGLRLLLSVPVTPTRIDFVNQGDDRVLDADGPAFAEVSLRQPAGFGATPPLIRHIRAAASVPSRMRLAPEVRHYGSADAGSTATSLVDADPGQPADTTGLSVRFLTGALAGQRRAITGGAAGVITTAAFSAAPAPGDRYAIEGHDGITLETDPTGAAGPGVQARLALSTQTDRLLATRATPQVKLRNLGSELHSATARVYGLRELNLHTPTGLFAVRTVFDPARRNTALRAQLIELDTRFAPADRDTVKVRIASLPDTFTFARDSRVPAAVVTEITGSAVTGPGVMWSEPGVLRTDGPRTGTVAGIGLAEFDFDRLPRQLRVTSLPGSTPPNFSPLPAGWISSGTRFETSDDFRLSNVWNFAWDRDHPSSDRVWWSESKIPFLAFTKTGSGALGGMTLWTPSERPAADPAAPDSGLGFRIDDGLLVTLDLNSFSHEIAGTGALRWNSLGGTRSLAAELQMKDYRGEVTVASPLGASPAGDPDAGPGQWFLRIVDGRPWYIGFGSVYFGNTGGILTSRPRIFA